MLSIRTDIASFTGAGHGRRIPTGVHLAVGDRIAVTDVDADTLEAEVLTVTGELAEVRIRWDRVLRRA